MKSSQALLCIYFQFLAVGNKTTSGNSTAHMWIINAKSLWVSLCLCNTEHVCVDLSPRYIPHSYLQSFICSAVFVYLW